MTFVEVLVAIVLLGTVGLAVLAAMQSTIRASATERDHVAAHQWLQSAIQNLEKAAVYQGCDFGEAKVRAAYQDAVDPLTGTIGDMTKSVRDPSIVPSGWAPDQIAIEVPIHFWDGELYKAGGEPPAPGAPPVNCFDDSGLRLQLVTIVVESPDGRIVETVEVVLGD